MALSTSDYRVIRKDGRYAIHEVFYDEPENLGPAARTQFALKATRSIRCARNWSTTNVPLSCRCWSMGT